MQKYQKKKTQKTPTHSIVFFSIHTKHDPNMNMTFAK